MESRPRALVKASKAAAIALVLLMLAPSLHVTAAPELPHENFDLVGSDLDMVIALLNSSIRASEESLRQMYNEDISEASLYLSMVGSVLVPANQMLMAIKDVAGSYENLSALLPPFVDLEKGMSSFVADEASFLSKKDDIVTASQLANLTDEDLYNALQAITEVFSLIKSMNGTIDEMLVSADKITALTVEGDQVFAPNELRPLIEKLRELLDILLAEIEQIIYNDTKTETQPWLREAKFLILWLDDSVLYLGEDITGRGLLCYNGTYQVGATVDIFMDSRMFMSVTTRVGGAFSFTIPIPLDASWLGTHTFVATHLTPFENLSSAPVSLTVILVPTSLVISADKTLMSIDTTVSVTGRLEDVNGDPIANGECNVTMDSQIRPVTTDANGEFTLSWSTLDLWFGGHQVQAAYSAVLPYADSTSNTVRITINIPTTVTFELFADKFWPGSYITGAGALFANGTQRLPGQLVTIYIDGVMILNTTTTELGEFAISYFVEDLERGTHVLRAAFLFRDVMWRYSEIEVPLVIASKKEVPYPFFPYMPGWNTDPLESFPNLFFGSQAYFTWLVIIIVLAIAVKSMQIRKARRMMAMTRGQEEGAEPIMEPIPDVVAAALSQGDAMFDALMAQSPQDPNGRIIWYYNSLIAFLTRKRKLAIPASMTHWEVARLLKSIGYPRESVDRLTMLFEQAFYSGERLTEVDSVSMSMAMDGIRGRPAGGGASAG